MTDFGRFFLEATGYTPYPYQSLLATDGLPDVLHVDTGCGKTEAAALAWLWRRRHAAREETPRWLVYALPMRALVDQTFERFVGWRRRLGLEDDLGVHCVMGGVSWSDHEWRLHPERDSVFVGTVDMLLSRALNRGFADSRWNWPMSFGAFNSGCQWVFDETQLMDTAVSTGRQLQAFRDGFGTVQPTRTTWMSATVDFDNLVTVDAPTVGHVVAATAADLAHPNLAARLDAPRSVRQIGGAVVEDRQIAQLAIEHHRPGTLTLVVANTVQRAQTAFKAVQKTAHGVDAVLIHSRFRQADREAALARLTNRGEHGMIAVATQVAEAGLDISATTLLTDLAPWSSLVQRAGRCNRTGTIGNAQILWMRPGRAAPYTDEDLEAAEAALTQLPDMVTPRVLSSVAVTTMTLPRPTLRRRDLVELFDTLPDLSGNDVDVGRFIRDSEDRDVMVLWREVEAGRLVSDAGPGTSELCRVPIGQLRPFLRTQLKKPGVHAFKAVPRGRERWTRLTTIGDLRPNLIVALDAKMGGYTPEVGWYGTKSKKKVPAVAEPAHQRPLPDRHDQRVGDDPNSTVHPAAWLTLKEHLEDTEAAVSDMVDAFGTLDLSADMVQAARLAAGYHDIGKAHDVFQNAIRKTQADGDDDPPGSEIVLAKGGSKQGPLRYAREGRPHFRHDLVSALMLLGPERALLEGVAEPDLVVYLAAAHHGRVRLGARRLDDERCPPGNADCDIALGVVDGDHLRAGVELPDAVTSGGPVALAHVGLGSGHEPTLSYTARMLTLRDRSDLGPFRLAWLEMLVRAADWRASATPRAVT